MDKVLTRVFQDANTRWDITIISASALNSFVCGIVTQNVWITIIYTLIAALIDIFSAIDSRQEGLLEWEEWLNALFEKRKKLYKIFPTFAMLPVFVGILTREIKFRGIIDVPSILFMNIFPNICGALMLCSLIAHINKLGEKQFVVALIQSHKGLFNISVKMSVLFCFLNAVYYKADENWKWGNLCNSIYLFFIILLGAVLVVSFFSRLVDDEFFAYPIKEVFPIYTMFTSALFLFSCNCAPLLLGIGKHEPILLAINTISLTSIFAAILYFLHSKRRLDDVYPIIECFLYVVLVGINCYFSFNKANGMGDIKTQVISGGCIMTIVIIIFFYLKQLKNKHKFNEEKRPITERKKTENQKGKGLQGRAGLKLSITIPKDLITPLEKIVYMVELNKSKRKSKRRYLLNIRIHLMFHISSHKRSQPIRAGKKTVNIHQGRIRDSGVCEKSRVE